MTKDRLAALKAVSDVTSTKHYKLKTTYTGIDNRFSLLKTVKKSYE